MDKEKVIKGMEMCISQNECSPDDCPYYIRPNNESGLCWDRLMTDALAMLKEQDAVKPMKANNPDESEYCCGICGYPLWSDEFYCAHCGRRIGWEGR